MDFALTEEQRDLTGSVRRYLADRYPPARIAELADAGAQATAEWPELRRQGWLDPDLGLVELGLLAEESGYALHPTGWWATMALAAPAYRAAGEPPVAPATLAWPWPPAGAERHADRAGCEATPDGAGWRLSSRLPMVVDAGSAAEVVVAAGTGEGVALFAVVPDAPGVSWSHRLGIDPLRPLSQLDLAEAPARLLVPAPDARPVLDRLLTRASALLACEAVGVGARALAMAVEHAKVRVQFDRPIGSYQAVAHQLAEAYAEVELARSLAYRAVCVAGDTAGDEAGPEALACARHAGRRAALLACETAIQVHGGLGATWEFPLHRWYRRALWLDAFDPVPTPALETVAAYVLDRDRP
jgi:alkylation response protein AidB-like acyl-CoA dehydrogenase